jgi:hypothetical protein
MAFCAVIVKLLDAVADVASVTVTPNVAAPAVVAVPLIAPPEESERPAGREPDATAHEYGAIPPLALSVQTAPETALDMIGFGTAVVVMVS